MPLTWTAERARRFPDACLALATAVALLGRLLVPGTASAFWSVDWLRSLTMAARMAGLFAAGLPLVHAAESIRAPRRLTFLLLVACKLHP